MRLLVWQWGRRGAGPRFASMLVTALGNVPDVKPLLSLSAQAEILCGDDPPACDLAVPTYDGLGGFLRRAALTPAAVPPLAAQLKALGVDQAVCAMPGPLDMLMARALHRIRVPFAVVVHDADAHPGDGFPMQMTLQRRLMHRADGLITLSSHVAGRLAAQGLVGGRRLHVSAMPPLFFGPPPPPPRAHGGRLRLLSFGRLLPYKGLDLLAEALAAIMPRQDLEVRVVGSGPESPPLAALRALPDVAVENRWVPEEEIATLLGWADALVLPYREASQSGVAAAAVAAGRFVVATRVGGLAEQLKDQPLALLCEPTREGLSAAMLKLIELPPAGRVTVASDAGWQDLANTLAEPLRQPE